MRGVRESGASDRGFLSRLMARVGNPFTWTDVEKSVLLCAPALPFVLVYLLRIERLLAHPERELYIDRPSLRVVQWVLFGVLAIFVAQVAGWALLRRRKGEHRGFVLATICTWFVVMALASYAVGPFSSPVLVGFLAGGMAAFLLFDVRRATIGGVLGLCVLCATTVLERLEVLPYGPVFAGVVFDGARPPSEWVWMNLLFTVALTSFVLGATGLVMSLARQRQAEIELLLRTDPLTGLANRRALDEALAREVSRARRRAEPLAFVLFDLDHFKHVNDTHGHRAGDAVLAAAGAALRGLCRADDVAARYGGEELALLLPATDRDGARAVAERVRAAIAALVTESDVGPVRITTSAGVAVLTGDEPLGDDRAHLVRAADAALYRAKANGRDRVEG